MRVWTLFQSHVRVCIRICMCVCVCVNVCVRVYVCVCFQYEDLIGAGIGENAVFGIFVKQDADVRRAIEIESTCVHECAYACVYIREAVCFFV